MRRRREVGKKQNRCEAPPRGGRKKIRREAPPRGVRQRIIIAVRQIVKLISSGGGTRKCVSVSGRAISELCTQKLCAVKRMDTETRFRVGHGNVFPCRDMYSVSYALKKSVQSNGWTRKRVSVSDTEMCFRVGTSSLCIVHSKNQCSQEDGHGNAFPCRTRICVCREGRGRKAE